MTSWKETNRYNSILRNAEAGKYGVIAAIAYNIEQILGFVQAAEAARSPLIIQVFPWAIEATGGLLIRTAADAAARASVPISIHLDHAQSESVIKHAADNLPFDSIMVDMSHYEKEINLQKTRELVEYCNQRQIATEAEPGRIEGGEDGVMDTAGLEACMTTAEEVDEFVATGVDALAPAFGNVHGEYGPQGPQLDYMRYVHITPNDNDYTGSDGLVARFKQIRTQARGRVSLALHGTNGFSPEILKRCVEAGVSKINVNRLVLDDFYEHLRSNVGKMPHTQLIEEGIQKVADLTVQWMEICGSAGKA
jgi:fructose-bisphosphate aldolase class II